MQRESLVKFFRLTPAVNTEYVAMVQRNNVLLNDSLLGFSFLEEREVSGFTLEWQSSREIHYDQRLETVVTIELSDK